MFWQIIGRLMYHNIDFTINKKEVHYAYNEKYKWEIDEGWEENGVPFLWTHTDDEDDAPYTFANVDEYLDTLMRLIKERTI